MTTASEEILARYKRTWAETDKFGRRIMIGMIRPNLELAVLRMIDSEDRTNQVTYLACACVRSIDEDDYAPPRQLADLDAIINKLDREGIDALSRAYTKMKTEDGTPKTEEEAREAAKN